MSELTDKLRTARGKEYFTILKEILAGEIGQQMTAKAQAIKDEKGNLTVYDVGALALEYDLNFKATVEWLEESRVLKTGAYQRLVDAGVKAQSVFKGVRERQAATNSTPVLSD